MFTLILVILLIYWVVRMLIVEDFFWAGILTAAIIFFFVDIDIEKDEVRLKTKAEIKMSIDSAHEAAIGGVEKAGETSVDMQRAFEQGKEKGEANVDESKK